MDPLAPFHPRHPEALGAQRRASKGDAEVIQLAHLWRHLGRSPSRLPRIKSGVAPQDEEVGTRGANAYVIPGRATARARNP